MSKDEDSSKNISGLSFRDIRLNKVVDRDRDILFLDEDISNNHVLFRIRKALLRFYEKLEGNQGFGGFVVDLLKYLSARMRIVMVVLSVLFEIFMGRIENSKDSFIRKLFWGRGDFLKSSVQFISVILVLVILLTYVYRQPNIQSVNAEGLDYIDVPQTDLLVMNATLNTVIPKDRERREVEKYIVKTGDTLSSIASSKDITVETIKWANSLSSDLVKPGQTLDIPPSDGVLITVK